MLLLKWRELLWQRSARGVGFAFLLKANYVLSNYPRRGTGGQQDALPSPPAAGAGWAPGAL